MWIVGFIQGVIATVVITIVAYLLYRVITRNKRHSQMMQNFGVLYDAGYRAGKQNVNVSPNGN